MATRLQISCVNKADRSNPHKHITHVGGSYSSGLKWRITEEEAISNIERGLNEYYVHAGGSTVDVIIAKSVYGHKFLKTVPDGEKPDNLLSLPECPKY